MRSLRVNPWRPTAATLFVVTVATLTACGGGTSSTAPSSPTSPPAGGTPPAGVPAPAPAPGPAPGPMPGPAPAPTPSPVPLPPPPAAPLPPVSSGARWSDPATWGGTMPPAGSMVVIPAGKTVVLDTQTPALKGLTIEGTLVAADTDIGITSDFVYVKGGRLQIGTAQQPFLRRATITLTGSTVADNPATAGFGNKVLALMDGVIELHGAPLARAWTRLNADVAAGARQLTLAEAPGWRVGDQIVIATSTPDMMRFSTGEIESISGASVTLRQPTANAHWGTRRSFSGPDGPVVVDTRAEVGSLSRNIVIQGDAGSASTRIGGHAMFMATGGRQSTVQIAHVEFRNMGQFNQLGRYPIHFHLMENRCAGCYVRAAAVHGSLQRGIVLHDSAATLDGNVVFNTVGHNIIVETVGTEGGVINGNLALVAREPVPMITEPTLRSQNDFAPANYWIKSARNTITNNHAAGAFSGGFIYDNVANGPAVFRGNLAHAAMNLGGDAFPTGGGLTVLWNRRPLAGEVFDGFTAYHNVNGYWPEINGLDNDEEIPTDIQPIVARNFILYDNDIHVFGRGPGNRARHENFVFIGGPATSNSMGVRNQYGGNQDLVSPLFINFNRAAVSAHDTMPYVAQFTVSNVRKVNSQLDPIPHDMAWITATDDTLYPRGTWVDAYRPYLATADCQRINVTPTDGATWMFKCPRQYGYGEIDVRSLAAPASQTHTTADILRSDGLRYRSGGYQGGGTFSAAGTKWGGGIGGYAALYDAGLHYSVTLPSAAGYAVRLADHSDFYDASVRAERATIELRLPFNAAPRAVYRGGPRGGYITQPTYSAGDALRPAATLAELRANPLTTYYYDAAARQVVVHASTRWTSVLP